MVTKETFEKCAAGSFAWALCLLDKGRWVKRMDWGEGHGLEPRYWGSARLTPSIRHWTDGVPSPFSYEPPSEDMHSMDWIEAEELN